MSCRGPISQQHFPACYAWVLQAASLKWKANDSTVLLCLHPEPTSVVVSYCGHSRSYWSHHLWAYLCFLKCWRANWMYVLSHRKGITAIDSPYGFVMYVECWFYLMSDGLLVLISSCKLLCLFRYPEEGFRACSFRAQRSWKFSFETTTESAEFRVKDNRWRCIPSG